MVFKQGNFMFRYDLRSPGISVEDRIREEKANSHPNESQLVAVEGRRCGLFKR